jgi:hypothetical protein
VGQALSPAMCAGTGDYFSVPTATAATTMNN